MHRTAATLSAIGLTATVVLLLVGCTSADDDGDRPTPSSSRTTTASATPRPSATATSVPSTPATAEPGPDAGSTTVPIPSAPPADDPVESAPSDFPATALVTYAGWDGGSRTLQAAGIVSGATDTSGTCTFTASMGGTQRERTSEASVSATSVNCAQVSFPRDQLAAGTWTVSLRYSLGGASVTSTTTHVEIP